MSARWARPTCRSTTHCRESRSIPTRSRCASTAMCGRSSPPPNCLWRSVISSFRRVLVLMTTLAPLLTRPDSRLPTGGHVHSGGVEEAVTSGLVVDLTTLRAYLRRRIRTQGLVTAAIAAAGHDGRLLLPAADRETDARTPSPAARRASRAQGRGLARLARRVWSDVDWAALGTTPHLAVAAGAVGAASGLTAEHTALSVVYTTM